MPNEHNQWHRTSKMNAIEWFWITYFLHSFEMRCKGIIYFSYKQTKSEEI